MESLRTMVSLAKHQSVAFKCSRYFICDCVNVTDSAIGIFGYSNKFCIVCLFELRISFSKLTEKICTVAVPINLVVLLAGNHFELIESRCEVFPRAVSNQARNIFVQTLF